MLIKTKDFQSAANTILIAAGLDKTAANVEISASKNVLALSVTNTEYYVRVNFPTESDEDFIAVVDAKLFLNLISGITTDEFELTVGDCVEIKSGKSNYKIPLNGEMGQIPVIRLNNKTVEMTIPEETLRSIVNVNGKELLKLKNLGTVGTNDPLRTFYYLTEEGCFTHTTGACLNAFTLEKPVKLLLNDRIVKLFKLFNTDVYFSFGHDADENGMLSSKVTFETTNIYVAAKVNCEEALLTAINRRYDAMKGLTTQTYSTNVVLPVNGLYSAINRLIMFTKNSVENADTAMVTTNVVFGTDSMTITDKQGNSESIAYEDGSHTDAEYNMWFNISDLKLVLDSYKDQHITLACGNHKSVVVAHGQVYNLIPESEGPRD